LRVGLVEDSFAGRNEAGALVWRLLQVTEHRSALERVGMNQTIVPPGDTARVDAEAVARNTRGLADTISVFISNHG
jgi:hypothetical protein